MGDARGAAERYLDVVRFGCDFRAGAFLDNVVGIAIAQTGLEAVGGLVVSDLRTPLPEVRSEMAILEGHLPTKATALMQERLRVVGGLARVEKADKVFGVPPVLPLLVPYRFLVAHAAGAYGPAWQAIQGASSATGREMAEGRGYRLWSVGFNGRDDGGTASQDLDLVLERTTRPLPAPQ